MTSNSLWSRRLGWRGCCRPQRQWFRVTPRVAFLSPSSSVVAVSLLSRCGWGTGRCGCRAGALTTEDPRGGCPARLSMGGTGTPTLTDGRACSARTGRRCLHPWNEDVVVDGFPRRQAAVSAWPRFRLCSDLLACRSGATGWTNYNRGAVTCTLWL